MTQVQNTVSVLDSPVGNAVPSACLYGFSIGILGSIAALGGYVGGTIDTRLFLYLLVAATSISVISVAAGYVLSLALRERTVTSLPHYWTQLSPRQYSTISLIMTIMLGGSAYFIYSESASTHLSNSIAQALALLYLINVAGIATLNGTKEKITLWLLSAFTYLGVLLTIGIDKASYEGLAISLISYIAAASVINFLSQSVHAEINQRTQNQRLLEQRSQLWSEIALRAQQIASSDNSAQIQEAVVSATMTLGYDMAGICIVNHAQSTYRYAHTSKIPEELLNRDLPLQGICGAVMRSMETEIVDYQILDKPVPRLASMGLRTTVGVPIWHNNVIVAVLGAGSKATRPIVEEERAALELLAATYSSALENQYITNSLVENISKLHSMLENAPNPMLVADENFDIILANKRADLLFGYDRDELTRIGLDHLLYDSSSDNQSMRAPAEEDLSVEFTTGALCKDGSVIDVAISSSLMKVSDKKLIAFSFRDITQQKQLEARLIDTASFDQITGLASTLKLLGETKRSVARHSITNMPITMIVFEFDHFTFTNPSDGTPDLAEALIELSKRVGLYVRGQDLFARIGQNRFAILADDLSESESLTYARRLHQSASATFYIDERPAQSKVAFGISFANSGITAEELFQRANSALRDALSHNEDISFFDEVKKNTAEERLLFENELSEALENDEFYLEYQPVVDIESQDIVAAEVLLRWENPSRGLVAPDTFIPIAEDTGLIVPIGSWLIRSACQQFATWRTQGTVSEGFILSLNVSRVQLHSEQILTDIKSSMDEFSIPNHRLAVEITETALLIDPIAADNIIKQLSQLGVMLAVDDFGTGYSSLSMLTHMPIDVIKIDKAFIDQLGTKSDIAIEAIAHMASRLNLIMVPEGIETASQERLLKDLGCKYGQGFYYSRPLRAQQFNDLMLTFNNEFAIDPYK